MIRVGVRHARAVFKVGLLHVCLRSGDDKARRAVERGDFRRFQKLAAAVGRQAAERGGDGVNRLVFAEAKIILAGDFVLHAHGIFERVARGERYRERLGRLVQPIIGRVCAARHAVRRFQGGDVFRHFIGEALAQREAVHAFQPPLAAVLAHDAQRFAFMLPCDGKHLVRRKLRNGEAAARLNDRFLLRRVLDNGITGAEYGQRPQQAEQPAAPAHSLLLVAHFLFLLTTMTMPAATSSAGMTPTTSTDSAEAVCCGTTSASTSSDLARMAMLSSCAQA